MTIEMFLTEYSGYLFGSYALGFATSYLYSLFVKFTNFF